MCVWGGVERVREGKEGGEGVLSLAATQKEGEEKMKERGEGEEEEEEG